METNRKPIYPIEPWTITETEFSMENNYRNETTFALSNGYIGTRGTFEEGYDFSIDESLEGNFINGFYDSEDIRYGEWNFGFPLRSQSLLNIPNAKTLRIYVGEEMFDMRTGIIENYKRVLDMKEAVITRSLDWTSPKGSKIHIEAKRLVSFWDKNCMAIRLCVTPLHACKSVRVESVFQADVENHTRKTNPLVDYGPFGRRIELDELKADEERMFYRGHTLKSSLSLACGSVHQIKGTCEKKECSSQELSCCQTYTFSGNEPFVVDKFIVYTSSLDEPVEKMRPFVDNKLDKLISCGYQELERKQQEYMKEFWETADVIIDGDDALQQGIRFNLFHIMQAAGRDGVTGMGAKGLSGEGYEGHYFWDTEMYVLPVFVYTAPDLARKLLDYRYHTLNQARERARVLGHEKGALYPWRTINGEEASTYFPLGTAQYHINADIAYAFKLYTDVSQDMDYLKEKAAEVLCETARVWADVGCFAESKGGRYCICAVTGPDEYNAIVDNNFYTNLMARENLRDAIEALKTIEESDPDAYHALVEKLDLKEEEVVLWQKIVENMYFPYDEKRQVYPLDDGFMMRKPWDDSKIPPEKRKLLYENYHPLFVYRQRMSKQADAILGMYLHSNLFTQEELKRNYDFYQEVTLHHSSLSTCIFGILACEIGYYEEAYAYFAQSARMDLDDYHNNFYAGIHAANMAGTWQAIVNGFAGLRTNGKKLSFKPYVPENWKGYRFTITYKGRILQAQFNHKTAKFILKKGGAIDFTVNEKEMRIEEEGGSCEYEI